MLFDVALVVFRHGFASGVEVHGAWRWLLPAVPLDHEAGERAEVGRREAEAGRGRRRRPREALQTRHVGYVPRKA